MNKNYKELLSHFYIKNRRFFCKVHIKQTTYIRHVKEYGTENEQSIVNYLLLCQYK